MANRRPSAKPSSGSSRASFPGASTNPLSKKQKGILCDLARQAFKHLGLAGEFAAWRHDQQRLVVGEGSLRLCTQQHFLPLRAHFADLAGEGGTQYTAVYRQPGEERRQVRHLLEVSLDARRLDLPYAEKICGDKFGCSLDGADAQQLWQIKFTVEKRRKPVSDEAVTQSF